LETGLAGPIVTITNLLESLVGNHHEGSSSSVTTTTTTDEEEVAVYEEDEEDEDEAQVGLLLRTTSMQDGASGGERCRVVLGSEVKGEKWAKVLKILDDEMQQHTCEGGAGLSYSIRSGRSSLLLHGPLERVTSARRRIMEVVDPHKASSLGSLPPPPPLPPNIVPTVEVGEEVSSSGSTTTLLSTPKAVLSPTTTTATTTTPTPTTTKYGMADLGKSSVTSTRSTAPTTIPAVYDPPPLLPRDLPGSLR